MRGFNNDTVISQGECSFWCIGATVVHVVIGALLADSDGFVAVANAVI